MKLSKQEIRDHILLMAEKRGTDSSLCPSEAAKEIGGEQWRAWMPDVHEQAALLSREGKVRLSQKGEIRKADQLKGPYRISISNE